MKLDNDCRQYIMVLGTALLQFYKVGMGTFLSLFVPQKCDEHACEILELAQKQEFYIKIGLCWNAFTLLMCLFTYMWELKRELWCIKHLDNEKGLAYNNLQYLLRDKASLNKSLCSLNVRTVELVTPCIIAVAFDVPPVIVSPAVNVPVEAPAKVNVLAATCSE